MPPTPSIFDRSIKAPIAKKQTQTLSYGNRKIVDDYAWLRAKNWREVMQHPNALPEDIKEYLEAENAYCDAALSDTNALQESLIREMRGRICETDQTVPVEDGQYAYSTFYRTGSEHPVYARQKINHDKTLDDKVEEILDANTLASECHYFDLGAVSHSPDHGLLAYAIDRQGSEFYEIAFKDLRTNKDLPDRLMSASDDIWWCADGAALLWIWRDNNNRPKEVRLHKMGQNPDNDLLIYREEDEGFFLNLDVTSDRNFLLIESNNHSTSEVRVLDAHAPQQPPRLIAPRCTGTEYHVDHAAGQFYILTNVDGAEDFKIITTPDRSPAPVNWQDYIPCKPGIRVLQQRLFQDYHVRLERENALPRIIVRDRRSGHEHPITMHDKAYDLALEGLLDFDTTRLRFCTSSMANPEQVFDYDMRTSGQVLRKTQDIPTGHDPDRYCTGRLMAISHDGEEVPVSLVYKKGLKLDGSAPLLLYGYGAYGITVEAAFSTRRLSLLDRGFVYAIAHIRGSEAKGHAWYKAAIGSKKPNTFHDYIAVANTLIDHGYTAERRIIAMGGSAGGLLVGAVMNMAPELFGGAIAAVPFVDVLNTMCDASLPLTPPEWPEWGNPLKDDAAFGTIADYSPYENVDQRPYPPVLATAGLTDPRVTYWEPAKWVAKLREKAPSSGPYLLKTEMQAGHAGMSGRFEGLKTSALEYAFAIKVAGL